MRKTKNQPSFDASAEFVVRDDVDINVLKEYGGFPCKIESCSFCYVVRGHIKAEISRGIYEINAHDLVVLLPGSFVDIYEISDDVLISFEGYSSQLLKKINFWKTVSPILNIVINNPVMSLDEKISYFYQQSFSIMAKASSFGPSFMTQSIILSALVVAVDMLAAAISQNMVMGFTVKNTSREQKIVADFMRRAYELYRSEHKIAYYAREASLTLSHFCNVISKTTGMTAQQIIMNLIIMDAKTQLKSSDATVSEIAEDLGFTLPTTFNRYFKKYTGMTPQEYRNGKDH